MEIKFAPKIEKEVGEAATELARRLGASVIASIEKATDPTLDEEPNFLKANVTLFRKSKDRQYKKYDYSLSVKMGVPGQAIDVKQALNKAFLEGAIEPDDVVVCVQGPSIQSSLKSNISIFEVKEVFLDTEKLKSFGFDKEVVESIVEIALEIARRGREGKKVGTAFILGAKEQINKYANQLILNPFENRNCNIKDKELKESIQEFSQLDGLFLINLDGIILSAGTYLNIDSSDLYLPVGYGTRHRACSAVTHKTHSLAILVSESGGVVKIFKSGKIVQTL